MHWWDSFGTRSVGQAQHTESWQSVLELSVRSTVQLTRRDNGVPGLANGEEGLELGGLARRRHETARVSVAERARRPLELCDSVLEHMRCRVSDPAAKRQCQSRVDQHGCQHGCEVWMCA
jgi:hypothetical protein